MEHTKSLLDLENEIRATYDSMRNTAFDIYEIECLEDGNSENENAVKCFKTCFQNDYEVFCDLYHRYLGLALFKFNEKCEEEYTFKFEGDCPIESTIPVVSVSTIGGEGIIWFTFEDGTEIDDTDVSINNMMNVVDYFSLSIEKI